MNIFSGGRNIFILPKNLKTIKKEPFGPTQICIPESNKLFRPRIFLAGKDWMVVTHIHRKQERENFAGQLPIYIPFPETYPALPWDQQLFEEMITPLNTEQ